jgi:hypothetical protein
MVAARFRAPGPGAGPDALTDTLANQLRDAGPVPGDGWRDLLQRWMVAAGDGAADVESDANAHGGAYWLRRD